MHLFAAFQPLPPTRSQTPLGIPTAPPLPQRIPFDPPRVRRSQRRQRRRLRGTPQRRSRAPVERARQQVQPVTTSSFPSLVLFCRSSHRFSARDAFPLDFGHFRVGSDCFFSGGCYPDVSYSPSFSFVFLSCFFRLFFGSSLRSRCFVAFLSSSSFSSHFVAARLGPVTCIP